MAFGLRIMNLLQAHLHPQKLAMLRAFLLPLSHPVYVLFTLTVCAAAIKALKIRQI